MAEDGIIEVSVNRVSALDIEGTRSSNAEIKGMSWYINTYRSADMLCAAVIAAHSQWTKWEVIAVIEFTLSHPDGAKKMTEKAKGLFSSANRTIGTSFIVLDQLSVMGFSKGDEVKIEAKVWLSNLKGVKRAPKPNFNDSSSLHDIVILVGQTRFYLSKQILALHSPFFHALFNSDFVEKKKQEIEIKEVDSDEFTDFVSIIYSLPIILNDGICTNLLKLADRFQSELVLSRVEQYILDAPPQSTFNFKEADPDMRATMLGLADKMNLMALEDHCLKGLKTKKQIESVEKTKHHAQFSDRLVRKLVDERNVRGR